MNISDIFISPNHFPSESWQLGSLVKNEIPEGGITIFTVPDYRGLSVDYEGFTMAKFREELYKLAGKNFEIPICDLGDLIIGKTQEDAYHILEELCTACFQKGSFPIVIGGSDDLLLPMISALNFVKNSLSVAYVSAEISLVQESESTSQNYLYKLLSSTKYAVKNFHLLGYQQHLVNPETINLIKEVKLDTVRLSELMHDPQFAEPFLRYTDAISVNCNAVENPAEGFSVNPQVNGLSSREICGIMKEAGLGKNLKIAGIFNYEFRNNSRLNSQLLAQMVWYLMDGISIRKTHPATENFETFWVMCGGFQYAFQHEVFSGRWYFGEDEDPAEWIPCSRKDYDDAKKGSINPRFL